MDDQKIIEYIVQGMIYYAEFLASPPHMEHYYDGMCAWLTPKEGADGASLVYKVKFGDKSDDEIRRIISGYRERGVPDEWRLTPFSTPLHIRGLLADIGIHVSGEACGGMALPPEKMNISLWEDNHSSILVRKVNSRKDFFTWACFVNNVLFEYPILDPEQYYPLFTEGKIGCFTGYIEDEPAAVSAILNDNGNASLEFIATKPEHRRKGMGTAVCRAAIKQLLSDGAYCISLRATPEGIFLYKSLGFIKYFDF